MVSNSREECLSPTSASAYMLQGGDLTLVEEEGGAVVVVVHSSFVTTSAADSFPLSHFPFLIGSPLYHFVAHPKVQVHFFRCTPTYGTRPYLFYERL
jgi:hypothetical protein